MLNQQRRDYNNSGIDKFCDQRDLTRLGEDQCYLIWRNHRSQKPLKYLTYQYHPYGCEVQATCYPGQFYNDGHVNACNIDAESALKLDIGHQRLGNQLTNNNTHQELPMMPVQMPRIRGCHHVDTESDLRFQPTENWKACTQITEKGFNPVRFQYFSHLCYDPQETQFIIQEDSFQQAFNDPGYHRAGKETRHDRLEKYRNGCDYYNQVIFDRVLTPTKTYQHYGY